MLASIKKLRRLYLTYQRRHRQQVVYHKSVGSRVYSDERANKLLFEIVEAGVPSFITRFGSSELASLLFYSSCRKEREVPEPWNEHHRHILCDVSGFFPFTQESMDRFAETYFSFLANIDVLGVWNIGEENIVHLLQQNISLVNLPALEPYYFAQPWSKALANKKVLVIHPFAESIKRQYERRTRLFRNKDVLPSFQLQLIPAVQTVADNTQGFKDWFAALNYMCEETARADFDVAIVGAGAYGMPLANFIKMNLRKTAIHMGGATQLLFGIKGKRWEDFPKVKSMYNESWVNPSEAERPAGLEKVEGGSYW